MNEKYEAYKKRRDLRTKYRKYCERRDARRKLAVDGGSDEEEKWITTKNGEHILINGENEVVGGAGGALNGEKLNNAKSVPLEELKKREKNAENQNKEQKNSNKNYDPSKFVYNSPEAVELYDRISRKDYLPIDELLNHPVVKMLDKKAADYKEEFGDTSEIYTRKRMALRKSILNKYLKKGSAKVVGKTPEGYPKYDFIGPVKKEFKAEIVVGLPAAGKSGKIANPDSLKMGAFVLDSDTVKEMIPEFERTDGGAAGAVHKESRDINEKALSEFTKKSGSRYGDNIVIPTVGGKERSVKWFTDALEKAGYDITIKCQEADPVESANKVIARAIASGRIIESSVVADQGNPSEVYKKMKNENGGKYHMDEKNSFDEKKRQVVSYLEKIGANKKFIESIKRTESEYTIYVLWYGDFEAIKDWGKNHDLSDYHMCNNMVWAETL